MATIMDYLKWRGDLTFTQSPFCEIDNLILSCLSYVDFDDIVPEHLGAVTVAEASAVYFGNHSDEEIENYRPFLHSAPFLLKEMAKSKRFGKAELMHYTNKISAGRELQFSAIEIFLGDGTSYIAFRGTDDTLVGWREDFNMSIGNVPSEHMAAEYLSQTGSFSRHMLRVGGHSKGGHLALYAAAKCSGDVQRRILGIYNNDGPGFFHKLSEDDDFKKIQPRIRRFIPEFSIFGMLMYHNAAPIIIRSSNVGFYQHNAFTWQLEGTRFLRSSSLAPAAMRFSESMKTWLEQMSLSERQIFINDMFSVLDASGAATISELQSQGLRSMPAMLKQLNSLHPETKEKTDLLLKLLISQWAESKRTSGS